MNIEELAEFTEGLEVLLALILAFYVGNMTTRWWVIRSEGIGGIIKAVSDIVLLVGAIAHGDTPSERAIRNDVIRYGLLSHALLYYEAQVHFITCCISCIYMAKHAFSKFKNS